jgi:hypothetical protein
VACGSAGCQAAREYSLIRPPGTGFRWIRSPSSPATATRLPSCSPPEMRWGMPLCGRRIAVHPVLGQDRAQVRLAENEHTVEELPAQGADEPRR